MSIVGNAILLSGGETLPDAGGISFGGTYTFIRVVYPEGSTCTCTKGNITLAAEDTSGSYIFAVEVPSSGTDTWTVNCTNGSASVTDSIPIASARILSIELDYAYISVTYPTGSICTCTKGNTTLTASNTSGSYTFVVSVPSSGTDTWTVSCTDGTDNSSDTVNITSSSRTQSIELAYISLITFYIIYDYDTYEKTAESGMTWAEFASSSYKSPPPSIYVTSDGRISNTIGWEPMTVYLTYQGSYVYSTDEIVAGRYYNYIDSISGGNTN